MKLPIQLRLAAFFTVAVALILGGAGVVTYELLRHSLLAEIQRDVAGRVHALRASRPAPPYDLDTFRAPDVFIQIQAAGGTVTARSANLAGRSLPLPDAALRGQVAEVRLSGRPLFLAAAALPDGGHVLVARSPVTTYRALGALRRLLTAVVSTAMLLTLADGRVLVAGGVSSYNYGARAAEIWDPAVGFWTLTPLMFNARQNPAAVLLADGRVLVEGSTEADVYCDNEGGGCEFGPTHSTELYTP